MNVGVSDAVNALRWGLRHYALLFIGCFVAIAVVIPILVLQGQTTYQAQALVVAQRLDMNLEALPRYAEENFDNGEVATAVATRFGTVGGFDDIVPDRVSLVAEQDSIVLQVTGHDASAQTAADLANVAAAAFTDQLNVPGEGVGVFAVQSSALPPTEPEEQLASAPLALSVGIAAGLIIGLAVISLLLILRRPVLDTTDAAEIAGVPVLGTVTMPRLPAGQFPQAAEVDGLVPVCRRLLAMHPRTILLMSAPRSEIGRGQLSVAMAGVLGRVRAIRLVAAPELCAAAEAYSGEDVRPATGGDPRDPQERSTEITLVDGPHPLDVVAPAQSSVAILLVMRGMPERALRAAVTEHLGGLGSDRLLMVAPQSRGRAAGDSQGSAETIRSEEYPALVTNS